MPNSVVKTLTVNGTTYDLKDVDSESYAPKASPALTGTPTAPTASSGTNSTQIATTAFVQGAVSSAIGNVNSFNVSIVQSLPTTNIDTHTIYFISNSGSTGNIYDEYMYINNNWEKIGTTDVDLSGYLAKNNTTAFTPSGDYNPATKKYVDDSIPTVPTKVSDLTNDSGFITSYTETDPVFTASAAHGITSSDISNWNGKTSLELGTTSSTAFRGDYGNAAYAHAVTNKGSAFSSGLYKITTNSEGHVTAATAVAKTDITALGIPAQDTTYEFDGTYDAGTNKAATVATVTRLINAAMSEFEDGDNLAYGNVES